MIPSISNAKRLQKKKAEMDIPLGLFGVWYKCNVNAKTSVKSLPSLLSACGYNIIFITHHSET
jgi:hypothetical protein